MEIVDLVDEGPQTLSSQAKTCSNLATKPVSSRGPSPMY